MGGQLGERALLLRCLPAQGTRHSHHAMSRLFLILGDQLHPDPHPLLADFDPRHDRLLMVEAAEESTHVWSHKARSGLFLAAMRQRAAAFRAAGLPLTYRQLGEHPHSSLSAALAAEIGSARQVVMLEAGDYRVQQALQSTCAAAGIALDCRPDPHFLCSLAEFNAWAGDKANLRLEFFYRWQRKRHGALMVGSEPVGGQWNFDADNRQSFGRQGPGLLPPPPHFAPDAITRAAIADVERHFPDHPGSTAHFGWPVTTAQAHAALDDFIAHRLPEFGRWQDAMWSGQPFLWHSLLSTSLNLKLLDPRTVIAATVAAYESSRVPLAEANQYAHTTPLPAWFWSGRTDAACLAAALGQTLEHGYAHHIQRLMITGNFALLAGLQPRQVADWYLAVYVDAVAWIEEPNTLGMALNAWPGMTSKPYCASGAYIDRMSDYCRGCRYAPTRRVGPDACPFTTLYWDFLARHADRFAQMPRMALPLKNLRRLPEAEREAIADQARARRAHLDQL